MQSEGRSNKMRIIRGILPAAIALAVVFCLLVASVFAWLASTRNTLSYAPVASPEPLFIGAGHRDFDAEHHKFLNDHFEDIRYLYFNGIDVEEGRDYYDYVFCVYGNMVPGYKIQLSYTTNNQFTYQIFRANESTTESEGSIAYTTHTDTPRTYYYTPYGDALAGNFVNAQTVNGETIADNTRHTQTYGAYNNVDKYGEPLYWQTSGIEPGYSRGDFINYYILRVNINDKAINDRETDVICFAAKSFSH